MQMHVSVMLLRSMQNTKELADAKAENDALRDDVAAGRRQFARKQSVSQCVKPPPPPAWIMQPPPPTGRHVDKLFHPQRLIRLCKNNWKEPRSILMSSADRVAHIDGQLITIIVSNTRASSGYKCLSNKTEQSIYECCWVSVLTTFLRRHKFWLRRQFSSAQFQKQKMMGDGFLWCYCCRFVLNSKRLLSTSCNKQEPAQCLRAFFHGVIPDAFEVRRIVCVEN